MAKRAARRGRKKMRPTKPSVGARSFDVVIEEDEGGWLIGSVPELPGCHTQARSLDVLKRRIVEAIELYLDAGGAPPTRTRFVGIHRVEVSS